MRGSRAQGTGRVDPGRKTPARFSSELGKAALFIALALWAAWLGIAAAPPILGDDAAITLRYAERLAAGRGFTYNDHERVLGASNPLYVLLVALPAGLGAEPEAVARAYGLLFFIGTVLLAGLLAGQLSGGLAAALAGALLAADAFFRYQALSGLESGLACVLGLGSLVAVAGRRAGLAGALVGLAVWNKLDALALALAVLLSWLWVWRSVPWRLAAAATGVVLPWLVFSTLYFGSAIPNSVWAKLRDGREAPFDPFWVLRFLHEERRYLLIVAGCTLFVMLRPQVEGRVRLAAIALSGWGVFHGLAYSLVNLGAPYPWYLTAMVPPAVILAAVAAGRLWRSRRFPTAGRLVLAGVVAIGLVGAQQIVASFRDARHGRQIHPWEAFDADRRLAGIFLDQYAAPGEVVESGFGWVAFECRRPFNDESGLNSRRTLSPVTYIVTHGIPWTTGSIPPQTPQGFVPLASFDLASHLFPGYSWFTVFGREDSAIARGRGRADQVDELRLRDDLLIRAWRDHREDSAVQRAP